MGLPGILLTLFVWPDLNKGNPGIGQVTTVAFLIPPNAIEYWTDRLRQNGISFVYPSTRFDGTEQFIAFHDPDGMMLELIAPSAASSSLSSYTRSKEI
jgi:glyoxalase family protein